MSVRHVYLLDLKDIALADEYEAWHRPGGVPAEVLADIAAAGVTAMEIYRSGDRLVMIAQSADDADPDERVGSDASREWEARMDRFQKPLPWAAPGVKWQPADPVFDLAEHLKQEPDT